MEGSNPSERSVIEFLDCDEGEIRCKGKTDTLNFSDYFYLQAPSSEAPIRKPPKRNSISTLGTWALDIDFGNLYVIGVPSGAHDFYKMRIMRYWNNRDGEFIQTTKGQIYLLGRYKTRAKWAKKERIILDY